MKWLKKNILQSKLWFRNKLKATESRLIIYLLCHYLYQIFFPMCIFAPLVILRFFLTNIIFFLIAVQLFALFWLITPKKMYPLDSKIFCQQYEHEAMIFYTCIWDLVVRRSTFKQLWNKTPLTRFGIRKTKFFLKVALYTSTYRKDTTK